MSTAAIAHEPGKRVARPLHVLAPLIAQELARAEKAAEEAGMPYFKAAGEKLLEAKAQLPWGEFTGWVKRNFKLGERHARRYMALARTTNNIENGHARPFSSLNEFVRATQETKPVTDTDFDTEQANRITQEHRNREQERLEQHKLALELIAIGFKALAARLHPDKIGGSREAMSRLNEVRARLRASA